MERIGDRVAKLMKVNGYNQKELAGCVGVTEAAMSRYLKNDREPKLAVVGKMAKALHTTTDYLIYGQETTSDFDDVYQMVSNNVGQMSDNDKILLIKTIAN